MQNQSPPESELPSWLPELITQMRAKVRANRTWAQAAAHHHSDADVALNDTIYRLIVTEQRVLSAGQRDITRIGDGASYEALLEILVLLIQTRFDYQRSTLEALATTRTGLAQLPPPERDIDGVLALADALHGSALVDDDLLRPLRTYLCGNTNLRLPTTTEQRVARTWWISRIRTKLHAWYAAQNQVQHASRLAALAVPACIEPTAAARAKQLLAAANTPPLQASKVLCAAIAHSQSPEPSSEAHLRQLDELIQHFLSNDRQLWRAARHKRTITPAPWLLRLIDALEMAEETSEDSAFGWLAGWLIQWYAEHADAANPSINRGMVLPRADPADRPGVFAVVLFRLVGALPQVSSDLLLLTGLAEATARGGGEPLAVWADLVRRCYLEGDRDAGQSLPVAFISDLILPCAEALRSYYETSEA